MEVDVSGVNGRSAVRAQVGRGGDESAVLFEATTV